VEYPLDSAPGGPFRGDVDVLMCNLNHPERAVAVEVKRVKYGMSQLRKGTPSKLGELKKAVEQTNRLAMVGFWKVYLYVITVVDSREQNQGHRSYAGLSNDLKQKLDSAISLKGLNERAGVFTIDFTQSMDNSPLTIDSFGGHLRCQASDAPQSEEMTEWVTRVMS
jgi:hypothetical protein